MVDREIRRKVLQMLYDECREHPYSRITPKEFQEGLHISIKELNFNMIYLESKGYVELQKLLEGSVFVGARITAQGIDLIEDEYEFDTVFPPAHLEQNPAEVFSEIGLVIDQIKTNNDIDQQTQELLISRIEEISSELTKTDLSYSTVKRHMQAIRKLSEHAARQIAAILHHPAVTRKLTFSARQELEKS